MKQARILKIVVASPGDVQAERDRIPAIVDELNKGIADERGVRLEVYRWETDAFPAFHPRGPQGQIDSCLRIEDCCLMNVLAANGPARRSAHRRPRSRREVRQQAAVFCVIASLPEFIDRSLRVTDQFPLAKVSEIL
jgi:hypothetical protein